MPLPVYFPTVENTIDETTGLPIVKLATGKKTVFGGTSFKNFLTPENSGGTTVASSHVGADSSRVYNTKDDIIEKMVLLYNAHGGVVTPQFGVAVTSPDQPFNFAGIALSSSPSVSENWILKTIGIGDVSPPQRSNSQIAYHADVQRNVLFGGEDNFVLKNDTWEWDGTRWVERVVSGPVVRKFFAMTSIKSGGINGVFLYGGLGTSNTNLNDSWFYNTGWTQFSPGTTPGARYSHAMAWDSNRSKVVLFGGTNGSALSDTWEFDAATSNWAHIITTTIPAARTNHAMAYDIARNKTVLFSGTNNNADTWEYNGTDWTQIFVPGTLPPARSGAKMVYNSTTKKMVLFGGLDSALNDLTDTWEYDGNSWTQINTAGPSPREYFGMDYDPGRDKVVLFGGANTTIIGGNKETWEFGIPIRPVTVQTSGNGLVYYDASAGLPVPVVGDFLGSSAINGTVTPLYDGYSAVFGIAADDPVPLSTVLSADITSFATTITVGTTTGFPGSGTIFIGSEQITYTSTSSTTFAGCTRGANSTTAAQHASGTAVYSTVPLSLTINGATVGVIKMRIRPFYGFIPPLPPSITGFSPSAAKVGDIITLTGTVFIGTTQVTINDTPSANATFNVISNNQITFTVPASAQKGTITVTNAQGNSTSATNFTTLPTITSATAAAFSVGSTVAIFGHTFTYTSSVKFNGVNASSYIVQNDGYVTAVIPVGGTSGNLDLTITYPTGPSSHTVTYPNFNVVAPPVITNVAPLSGPIGAFVSITGSGLAVPGTELDGYGTVEFIDVATMTQILPATRTVFNDTTISAIVPNPGVPQPSTSYYVRVKTSGGTIISSQQYAIIPVPKFHTAGPTPQAFSPTSGVAGNVVNIIGDYGFTGVYQVTFDGYVSPTVNFINDGFITAVVPTVSAPTDAMGPISVSSIGGTRSTADAPSPNPINFTILQTPTITSFSPTSGKTGDSIAIFGVNLLSVSSVKFEGMSASAVFSIVNSGRINVTVPAAASGILQSPTTAHIIITKGVLPDVTSTGTFLYYPPPTSLAISSPAADGGGINGGSGTSVTVTGSNLTQGGTPTVTLGGINCTVTSASPGNVIFTAPSSGVSSNNLTLTTLGGTAGPITFNYLHQCTISSFSPHSVQINYGGDTVHVYGSNFRPSPFMTVYATDPAQGYMVVYLSYTYYDSGHFSFTSPQLSPLSCWYPDHNLYLTVVTNYPGNTYSTYVYGLVGTCAIG